MFEKLIMKTRVFQTLLKDAESYRDLLIKSNEEKNKLKQRIRDYEDKDRILKGQIKLILRLIKVTDERLKEVKQIKKICKEILK